MDVWVLTIEGTDYDDYSFDVLAVTDNAERAKALAEVGHDAPLPWQLDRDGGWHATSGHRGDPLWSIVPRTLNQMMPKS